MAEIRAKVLREPFIFVGITHFVTRIGGIKPSHIKEVQKTMGAHAESDDDHRVTLIDSIDSQPESGVCT